MVDPIHFTNYSRTDVELEECILFSVCVAGKNAITTAKCLDNFLQAVHQGREFSPFKYLKEYVR